MLFLPRREGRFKAVRGRNIGAARYGRSRAGLLRRNDFCIVADDRFAVFRNVENDRVGILFFYEHFPLQECAVCDDILACHDAVRRIVRINWLIAVMNQVDDLARTKLCRTVYAGIDGRAVYVGITRYFQHSFSCICIFRDVEIEGLEIAQVFDGISLGVKVERIICAFSLAITAVKAHHIA